MFSDQGGAAGSVTQRVVRPATLLKTPTYVVHAHKNGPWYRALLYRSAAVASAPCFRTNDHNNGRRVLGPPTCWASPPISLSAAKYRVLLLVSW